MEGALRRMGHILANSPDNIAQQLRHAPGNRHPLYMMSQGWVQQQPVQSWTQPAWQDGQWQQSTYSWNGNPGWNQPMYPSVPWTGSAPPLPVADTTYQGDSETDSETVSSVGLNQYDYSDIPADGTPDQKAEQLFWAYQRAKGRWRRFMNKPNRRVRRFFKRKGVGKGKSSGAFLMSFNDQEIDSMFFGGSNKGRGKAMGKRSSGKGKGRRMNPKGLDGQPLSAETVEVWNTSRKNVLPKDREAKHFGHSTPWKQEKMRVDLSTTSLLEVENLRFLSS